MMKRILFLASLLIGLGLAFAPLDAPRVIAQTFSGQPSPGYVQIGQGAAQPQWLGITGCSLTSAGSMTCPGRVQLTANRTYYVNGNSAATNNTTSAGNATLHFAAGSGTTNNTTAAGSTPGVNNVLHFASVPVTVYVGATITDTTSSAVIPLGTTVTAVTQFSVTLSNFVTGGGVGNGDTIQWSLNVFPVGATITDTTASVIPANTTISSVTPTTVVMSANATGLGVGNGDTIQWTAACGTTGASTCGIGSDSNNGTAPATPFLTAQKAVNTIIDTIDLNGFTATVNYAHGASTNYSAACFGGPVLGQAVFGITGDSTSPTYVGVVVNSSGAAFQIKDLCTVSLQNLSFYDRPTNNGVSYISFGTGAPGHVDAGGLTFNSMTIGTFVGGSYSGATLTFTLGGNQINGGAASAFGLSAGAGIDFSSINNAFTVVNNLTWSTGFAYALNGGIFNGIVQLGATGTFGNPTGHSGPRCVMNNSPLPNTFDPNSLFPGGTDCVTTFAVGALGVQSGSGASAALNYGTSGQALMSGGSSSARNTYSSLRQAIGAQFTQTIITGSTWYCATQGCQTNQSFGAPTIPMNGSFRNLYFETVTSPGVGQTYTGTIYTGTYGAVSSTSLTCSISGANTACTPDTTHTAAITAGQAWSFVITMSGGAASNTGGSWGVEFDNP